MKLPLIILSALFLISFASASPYISQGQIVHVNDTIDISGVVPPYPYLAYWDGYDMYESNASYIISLPQKKSGYYNFYVDPVIFENHIGRWYKYNGYWEKSSNNLAFVVSPQVYENSTMRYQNGTLVNISESHQNVTDVKPIVEAPPVPLKYVSDYLVARGDSWNITVSQPTNIWLFGSKNQLLDMKSANGSIDISNDILSGFSTGNYKLIVQTIRNDSKDFTVKYDAGDNSIKWFDPKLFTIHSENIYGYSPQVTFEKFQQIIPMAHDDFVTYNFVLQDPTLEIASIKEILNPNETVSESGEILYHTNSSYVIVTGYTNVAPGTDVWFILDEKQQTSKTLKYNTGYTIAKGDYGGYERWFQVVVPVDKYNLALGEHTVTGYTNLSISGTIATFTLYDSPPDSYVPSKEVRYISGRYGTEEFVPTPTPIIETVTVVQTVKVVETVVVPVTPSNEVVAREQQKAVNDTVATIATYLLVGGTIVGLLIWGISLYIRRRNSE